MRKLTALRDDANALKGKAVAKQQDAKALGQRTARALCYGLADLRLCAGGEGYCHFAHFLSYQMRTSGSSRMPVAS